VDQIFDRFERLFKSWIAGEEEVLGGRTRGGPRGRASGDSDFDAAMAELDDFLDLGRTETEAREKAESQRREREARARPSGPPPEILRAYRILGLAHGTPWPEVKAQYKRLLMKNHPDRNSATPEQLERSTEISAQINAAYQRLETWTSTGKVGED
jgi:hypothetical protein